MDKVATFQVDHTKLTPGVYVSRKDPVKDEVITTFDVRIKTPYQEQPLTPEVLHTLEHLGAVYLRGKSPLSGRILYWGPMGCQTGFDLLVVGDISLKEIVSTLRDTFLFIANFEGEIPGAQFSWQCGNYRLHDLNKARQEAKKFAEVLAHWRAEDGVYPARTN